MSHPTNEPGFQTLSPSQYHGDNIKALTTENLTDTTRRLLQDAHDLTDSIMLRQQQLCAFFGHYQDYPSPPCSANIPSQGSVIQELSTLNDKLRMINSELAVVTTI